MTQIGARRLLQHDGAFRMRSGGVLDSPVIAYETWGELAPARDNAVLLFTGLSPSAHAASSAADPAPGWWEEMVGPDKPIDTDRYFVICVNSLGSCFGSTGPASINPATGERYGIEFPVLMLEDVAAGGELVLRSHGIEQPHTVAGCSMGGMTALAWCMAHPGRAKSLLSISSSARAMPFAIALRSLQREMIRRDPAWRSGRYPPSDGPIQGMRLARKLGMITYRSAAEWRVRFGRERVASERQTGDPFGIDFEVESYLEAHANKFTGGFDANSYLYLSRAMDLFDAAEHGGSIETGVKRARVPSATVIGVRTDFLFPIDQQRELAHALEAAGAEVAFHSLPSIQGHDAFLVDMDRFRPIVCQHFDTGC
jgi:homoserine O-acetyltransferase